eukprot:2308169-Pyramimonas_sp.AAC.1
MVKTICAMCRRTSRAARGEPQPKWFRQLTEGGDEECNEDDVGDDGDPGEEKDEEEGPKEEPAAQNAIKPSM